MKLTDKKKNMELWNSVCETDPEATKKVNQRGGFTAIDAHSQIMAATEQFGPVGVGWGWDVDLVYPPNDTIVVKVTLWYTRKEQTVTQFGQKLLNKNFGKDNESPDEDAFKKAVTDGLTKCLSYLGFNADVFLGKFDDNKYIETLNRKKANKDKPTFEDVEDIEELFDKMVVIIDASNHDEYGDAKRHLSLAYKKLEAMQVKAPPESQDYVHLFREHCAAHAKKIGFTG